MGNNISIHTTAKIEAEEISIGDNVIIKQGVHIQGKNVKLGDNCKISDNTIIYSDFIEIGFGSVIDKNTEIKNGDKSIKKLILGDQVFIGNDVKIMIPEFVIMDYSKFHNHILVNGFKPMIIGYNCWFGQNAIFNTNEQLIIGNNFQFGSYSTIQTHASGGELLEGSLIHMEKPIIIADDVWSTGGGDIIGPGVNIGKRAIIMSPSLVTKDIPANRIFAGMPAKDITHKIKAYKNVDVDWKFEKMKEFVTSFIKAQRIEKIDRNNNTYTLFDNNKILGRIAFIDVVEDMHSTDCDLIIIAKEVKNFTQSEKVSVFDLTSKRYLKRSSKLEILLMKYLVSFRARFIPYGC